MLALRAPDAVLAPESAGSAIVPARDGTEPPVWWKLQGRDDVLGALRDVARATIARRLDPRTANTTILALQTLLGEERERRAEKRARREWAREQLRDRLNQLVEEVRAMENAAPEGTKIRTELGRLDGLVDYIKGLAGRARI